MQDESFECRRKQRANKLRKTNGHSEQVVFYKSEHTVRTNVEAHSKDVEIAHGWKTKQRPAHQQ